MGYRVRGLQFSYQNVKHITLICQHDKLPLVTFVGVITFVGDYYICGCNRGHVDRGFMYIVPCSGEPLLNLNFLFKWILRRFEVDSDVWSHCENAALFKISMKIHSNPPILYYGFKMKGKCNTSAFKPTSQASKCVTIKVEEWHEHII